MGKRYEVPETLTIMKAMEYAGFRFLRGAGCRGGICGACPTVYRKEGDYKLYFGLACQTVVEPNMYLAQIPFYPANRASYDINAIEPVAETIHALYPELFRCVACNNCTKACPMGVEVLDYISAHQTRGTSPRRPSFPSTASNAACAPADAWGSFHSITSPSLLDASTENTSSLAPNTFKSASGKSSPANTTPCSRISKRPARKNSRGSTRNGNASRT